MSLTPPNREYSWRMLAPVLRQKSPQRMETMRNYLTTKPCIETFTALDMFLRLSSLGKTQIDGDFLDLHGCLPNTELAAPSSPLESLPREILDQILLDGDLTPQDIVNLGVCSSKFWPCVLESVRSRFISAVGQWSNTPLICPFSSTQHFPTAINQFLPDLKASQDYFMASFSDFPLDSPVRVWVRRAFRSFTNAVDQIYERQRWLNAIESIQALECQLAVSVMPSGSRKALRSMLEKATRINLPLAGEMWVLRNLTKKEYIRFEVLESTEHEISAAVEDAPWLALDAAFFLLTSWCCASNGPDECWPLDKSVSSDYQKRGAWAANCFDIVRMSEQECAIGKWTDVTNDFRIWVMENSDLHSLTNAVRARERAQAS